ncbi:hypothetical protein [Komagataeibacter xylinus]|uniref:hypothetical protein n=1 Tax=Komagataeibacter xylinus TaxID=28448 RepID=UPI00280C3C67|nr:hypothetical protein [Komagataeibacter xylinus]
MSDWNGLPDQPERSGWHWVNWDGYELPVLWKANVKAYITAAGPKVLETVIYEEWQYICPCPDPSELAQMRKDERERAAKVAQEISVHYYALGDAAENDVDVVAFEERMFAADECAVAIRALTDDKGKKS